MVGMSQIKKKMWQGIAIGAGVGIVGIGLSVWWSVTTIKSYEDGTNKSYRAKYTKVVTVLNKDVIQGEMITQDMLTEARVHNTTVPTQAIESSNEVVGSVAKYNILANVALTQNMFSDGDTTRVDIRAQEVNTVVMPSDLVEGDKVDIRIMYPNGTDYIVLAQKNVDKIAGQTMWIKIGEDERLLLNSSMVDSFLKPGTKLYATKYADADSQIKLEDETVKKAEGYVKEEIKKQSDKIKTSTEDELTTVMFEMISKFKNFSVTVSKTTENYQPNSQVMEMMKSNANIIDEAKAKLSEEARQNIENGVTTYQTTNGDEYTNVVTGAQQSITNQKTQRQELIDSQASTTTVTDEVTTDANATDKTTGQ